jgi:hypothetical protein
MQVIANPSFRPQYPPAKKMKMLLLLLLLNILIKGNSDLSCFELNDNLECYLQFNHFATYETHQTKSLFRFFNG